MTATGVRAGAAEVESIDRSGVLGRAGKWSHHQGLINGELTVVPVAAGHTMRGLKIRGHDQLTRCYQSDPMPGRIGLQFSPAADA